MLSDKEREALGGGGTAALRRGLYGAGPKKLDH